METQRARDPRPARTRATILRAIETLERDGGDLTVSNVVRVAGISRSSFYAHFKDLDQLAVDLIRGIYDRIGEIDAKKRPTTPGLHVTRETVGILVDEFNAHMHLYAAVLGSGMSAVAQRQLLDIFATGAKASIAGHAPAGIDTQLAAQFLAGGTLGTLIWWVTTSPDIPKEVIREQLIGLYPNWITSLQDSLPSTPTSL